MDLTVLTWNIQNYGPAKQQYSDIVKAIATTVVNERADIFVLLEGNTKSPSKARKLAETMQKALQKASRGEFQICVLSPNTGIEFYAFFYRDENVTVPYTTSMSEKPISTPKNLSAVQFKSGRNKAIQRFGAPLVKPDIDGYTGRHTQVWPGTRYPSFALFCFNVLFQ